MKLLFIIPSITNYFTFLEDLVHRLHLRGHEVHLASSNKHIAQIDAYQRPLLCTLHNIDFPRALDPVRHFAAAGTLRKLVRSIKPDIVNVHFSAAVFTAMLAREKFWPPTTGTIHGLGSPLISGWRKLAISMAERWSAKNIDELYVLTQDDQKYLSSKAPEAVVKVLNSFGLGCDLNRFNQDNISETSKAELRRELKIDIKDFVFIFIGRQTNFKGFDKVIKSFLGIYAEKPHQKLLLIGAKDSIHPTNLGYKYEKALKEHPRIISAGWKENVQDYLSLAHLNVFPSMREGLPVNLMESLAMGVPVITINSRGCRDVVEDGITGVVLSDNEVEPLSRAMSELRDDENKRNAFSKNALEQRGKFDRNDFIKEQFEMYERLTGKKI